jgi:hypothetical protein
MARLKYPLIKLWLTSNLGIDSNLCYVAIKVIFPSSSSSSLEPTSPPNRIHIDEADNKPKSGQSLRRNRKQVLRERWLLPRYLPPPPFPCELASSLTTNPTLTTLFRNSIRRPRCFPRPRPHLHKTRRCATRLGRPRRQRKADARRLDDVFQQAVQRRRSCNFSADCLYASIGVEPSCGYLVAGREGVRRTYSSNAASYWSGEKAETRARIKHITPHHILPRAAVRPIFAGGLSCSAIQRVPSFKYLTAVSTGVLGSDVADWIDTCATELFCLSLHLG